MDEGTGYNVITKIKIPTNEVNLELIQEVLHKVRTHRTQQNDLLHNSLLLAWTELLETLWEHLQTGLKGFDEQLLCSVCFFTALEFTDRKDFYLEKILMLIKKEVLDKEKLELHNDFSKESKTLQVVSLMYGLLQSKCVVNISYEQVPEMVDVLNSSLDLLFLMAYEYSRYTFIVFKILSSFKTVCSTELEKVLFHSNDSKNLLRLINLANHNWENPINGVRDLNKSVFQMAVTICDSSYLKVMIQELEGFYWNKAKYLMIAEMLESQDYLFKHQFTLNSHLVDGLLYSLCKTGLVSAGADMYYAILKKLRSEWDWCNLFLNRIIIVLHGNNTKAIENFTNYWCLTTFKIFPGLAKVLIDELEQLDKSEMTLFSSLCILKQANKLGLVCKKWETNDYQTVENRVLDGIEHCKPNIRMLAFEIIAVSLGKAMPTAAEYKLILNYLYYNINSDCTVLRISMLGNTKCFLNHLCASYTTHVKNNRDLETDNLEKFYRSLQEFIIESLNSDGNYQRKITTIKLCNILLSSFNEVSKKRQKQKTTSGTTMVTFLIEKKCLLLFNDVFLSKLFSLLKDPADDIREMTVQLLLDHYSKEINPSLFSCLIEDAKVCIKSKFFYEISCAQSMFRLISSLILKENFGNIILKNIDDVFNFAFDVLKTETMLKTDIVRSIIEGKQLHAYLCILQEVLKTSKQFSYHLKTLKGEIPELLNILENISNQFAWEEDPAVSSDFSKMSDMVKDIIASSGYNPLDGKDLAKISGLEQIVLNCLWLNVKASCDFASYLISFLGDEEAEACGKCLGIITHVLETSRHKGAIEAAGAALGRAIQYLTSLPESSPLAKLPRSLLQRRLGELLAHARASSVTRRGAGLSIMLHRVVSSDMEKGKPLFHYFMETLLNTCNSADDNTTLDDSQRDVPKAVYIHFLTRIVTDSSLASDMMYYSADLAGIAFDNLTSPHWQIRNAALQLYGALIPKLIGQKKASGSGDETVATVAIDEFMTHSRKLWQHMKKCVQELNDANTVESHSNVLPILNVLANLAKRYNFTHGNSFECSSEGLLEHLMVLLGSPIFTVRRLTAKCIFNLYNYDIVCNIIVKLIENHSFKSENLLHGTLILIGHYNKHLQKDDADYQKFMRKFCDFINQRNHSYICKREAENLFCNNLSIQDVLSETKRNKYFPGVFHWANNRLQNYIQSCSWDDIPNIFMTVLQERDFEKYCELILIKLEMACNVPQEILVETRQIIYNFKNKFQSSVIWKILYHISQNIGCSSIDLNIFNHLETDVPYRIRFVIPYLASAAENMPEEYLLRLSNIILSLCDPDKSDVDMRYMASLGNNELAKSFPKISDSVKITAIICAVLLLQDEDDDVRMINIHFYSNIKKEETMLQPYVCLAKILDKDFLHLHIDNAQEGIPNICNKLLEILETYAKPEDIDEYNPFSNDSKNIYFEASIVKKLIHSIKG